MQDNPLVSIIVPVYKVEPYLRRCLNSIVNQTYTNLEIVLVDDGSPDNCPAICDEYAAKDNRIVVIHKENGGLSDARNAGLNICKGEWISFVDSDDWVSQSHIQTFIDSMQNGQDYDFISANHSLVYENKTDTHCFNSNIEFHNNTEIIKAFCQENKLPISAWNKLYNTDFLKNNSLHFKNDLLFEDQLWCFQCALKAKNVKHLSISLYYYLIRRDSIMNSSQISTETRIKSWCVILKEIERMIPVYNRNVPQIHYFFLHKVQEALRVGGPDFKTFRRICFIFQEIMGEPPIYYWIGPASFFKKNLFKLLVLMPSYFSHYLLFKHVKKKNNE